MTKKKNKNTNSEYARSEIEFLSMMKNEEPIIAIISENDERRDEAVNWLSQKLQKEGFVAAVSLDTYSSEVFKKLDPDILIGDSLSNLRILLNEKALPFAGNRGYIYFTKNARQAQIKQWLGIDNRGQSLVEVWMSLNNN